MQEDRWLGWAGLIIAFIIFQVVRGVLRGAKSGGAKSANTGMARLNAAAERILKERGASVANPTPRQPAAAKAMRAKAPGGSKPHGHPPLPKSSSPAVIRRDGLLSSGREPVVQRRR